MPLIAFVADKGAPGVTTTTLALAAIWPRNVLMTECDPAGGDLVYRLPSDRGGQLHPGTGLLSLAPQARRGLSGEQVRAHTQRLVGGLGVLVGVTSGEQAGSLSYMWDPLGKALAGMPETDVLADCGRVGAHSPIHDLLRHARMVVLVTRASLEQVAHTRERVQALATELGRDRGQPAPEICVVVISDPKEHRNAVDDVARIVQNSRLPASVVGGVAVDVKGADMLRGEWGGKLDKSLLIRSSREVAKVLLGRLGAA